MSREIEINCGGRLVLGCARGLVAWTLLLMVIVWASAVCSALFAPRRLQSTDRRDRRIPP